MFDRNSVGKFPSELICTVEIYRDIAVVYVSFQRFQNSDHKHFQPLDLFLDAFRSFDLLSTPLSLSLFNLGALFIIPRGNTITNGFQNKVKSREALDESHSAILQ